MSIEGLGAVYELDPDAPLPPASTIKVTTGGAALLRLGPDFRFVTQVKASEHVVGKELNGDLIVRGAGDPNLTSRDLNDLATEVASQMRTVRGNLVLDTAGYDPATKNPGWKTKFTPFEVGLLSAFMVGGNHRGDAATLLDPDLANLRLFRDALTKAGVSVLGGSVRGSASAAATLVASHTSPTLATLVSRMLKDSENTYAEQLLRAVGSGSTTNGVDRLRILFSGADLTAPTQSDASGLSGLDRASARQLVGWLRHLDRSAVSDTFRSSLSVACVDGTLKGRLCNTPAAQHVWAKTGTLDSVRTIAGYGRTASGRAFTFAILLMNVANGRALIDQAITSVAGFTG